MRSVLRLEHAIVAIDRIDSWALLESANRLVARDQQELDKERPAMLLSGLSRLLLDRNSVLVLGKPLVESLK
jgi:hypothetical protein